jgi:hypothetical protein
MKPSDSKDGKPSNGEKPGEKPGQKPGQGQKSQKPGEASKSKSTGDMGSKGGAKSDAEKGDGKAGTGSGFIKLPERDRTAIQQSQNEKYPQEYGTQVEQYLKNLAEEEK